MVVLLIASTIFAISNAEEKMKYIFNSMDTLMNLEMNYMLSF